MIAIGYGQPGASAPMLACDNKHFAWSTAIPSCDRPTSPSEDDPIAIADRAAFILDTPTDRPDASAITSFDQRAVVTVASWNSPQALRSPTRRASRLAFDERG